MAFTQAALNAESHVYLIWIICICRKCSVYLITRERNCNLNSLCGWLWVCSRPVGCELGYHPSRHITIGHNFHLERHPRWINLCHWMKVHTHNGGLLVNSSVLLLSPKRMSRLLKSGVPLHDGSISAIVQKCQVSFELWLADWVIDRLCLG
jgi:hypothetical protein